MLLPILSPIAQNIPAFDKIAILIVCGSLFVAISVLSVFLSAKTERLMYIILLVLSIVPSAIFLAYLLFAQVLLEQNSVTSLFETNPEESKEFVAHYLSIWIVTGAFVYITIPVVMLFKMKSFKPLSIKKHKLAFGLSIVAILSIISINPLSRSVYFITFYKTFINYEFRTSYEIKRINERHKEAFDVNIALDKTPQTIIVVIGESLTRHHLSLYGYARKTNPLLSQYKDSTLYVYKDVISPQVHTIPVMRSVLTMATNEHPEYFTEQPSLFELFNRAGYDTYLVSNQDFSDDYKSSYDILLSLAKHKFNLTPLNRHDDVVLKKTDEILHENNGKNKLIVIHLIGNHMAYKFRYPHEYAVFDNSKDGLIPDAPYRDKEAKKMVDEYDNSVLYNDFIVDGIIKLLNNTENKKSVMTYFSDHGEELYDYRNFAGHAYEKVSPPMCEIPFMIWIPSDYKKQRNDLIFDINRPYSTEDFIYSISAIGGLSYHGFDTSRSILSSDFKPRERFIDKKKYIDIKNKFKQEE